MSAGNISTNMLSLVDTINVGNYPLPSGPLTNSNCLLSGLLYGNGMYIVSCSSYFNSDAQNAFDNIADTKWTSSQHYSVGTYTGGFTTTVSSSPYTGEWIQIQFPTSQYVTSFSFAGFGTLYPSNFVIAGSSDGSTWTSVYTCVGNVLHYINNSPITSPGSYIYYRLIAGSIYTGTYVGICSLTYNISSITTPAGTLSANSITTSNLNASSNIMVPYLTASNLTASNIVTTSISVSGSKTFNIPHPDPTKLIHGYKLRHSCIESPTRGETLYKYSIVTTSVNEQFTITLPSYFTFLNEKTALAFISPTNVLSACFAFIAAGDNIVQGMCQLPGNYNVLVIGTRNDQAAYDTFDNIGGVEYIQ